MKRSLKNRIFSAKLASFLIALVCVLALGTVALVIESNAQDLVICLDPGHGGNDSGAGSTVDGIAYYENPINLKIAKAARKYLLEYAGVQVVMTRETVDEELTLAQRVSFATRNGAHVVVSIHNNASEPDIRGSLICAANSKFRPQLTKATQDLGNSILSSLQKIGLKNRGLLLTMANQPTYTTYYPDGSLQDYYGIVMRSIRSGVPGIVVECVFISNADDVRDYLSTDEKLDTLGKQIAEGIAAYYGLSKETPYDAPVRIPIDARSLKFDQPHLRALFYPLSGTEISGTTDANFTNKTGKTSVYLDYMGMAVNTKDFTHVTLRLKGSKEGSTLRIYTANDDVITNELEYSYNVVLSEEYREYTLDFTKLPTWKRAFNYFQFDMLDDGDLSIDEITFKAGEVEGGIAPNTAPQTPAPTSTPTPSPTPEETPTPTPAPTEAPTETPEPTPKQAETATPEDTTAPETEEPSAETPSISESEEPGKQSATPDPVYQGNKANEITIAIIIVASLFLIFGVMGLMLFVKPKKNTGKK